MNTLEHHSEAEFWSEVYGERSIAIFNHYGHWHVYLDHVLQHNVVFATPEEAIIWLTDRVDRGVPGRLN